MGTIYCNPPFSNPEPWLIKGIKYHEDTGKDVIFFVSVRTGSKWWKQVANATGINFIEKPIKFLNKEGKTQRQSPFPSCLVAFGETAYERIKMLSGLCVRVKMSETRISIQFPTRTGGAIRLFLTRRHFECRRGFFRRKRSFCWIFESFHLLRAGDPQFWPLDALSHTQKNGQTGRNQFVPRFRSII
jgi:hypothetical protein